MPLVKIDPVSSIINTLTIAKNFGFEWPDYLLILDQIKSECAEIKSSVEQNESKERLQEEVGDLLHAALSLCTFFELNAQNTLELTSLKFSQRFKLLQEKALQKGYPSLKREPIETLRALWGEVKSEIHPNEEA